ncbi:MAG: CRTAC1 family protein [Gemmatimonadota bacterium]|nr:CRTAC1 family protein [Gemmatimonadota bacterium]
MTTLRSFSSLVVATAIVAACESSNATVPETEASDGVREMIERLAAITDANDFTERLAAFDTMPVPGTLQEAALMGARRGYFLLQAGRHTEASAQLVAVQELLNAAGPGVPVQFRRDTRNYIGLAAMWGAFEDACMAESDACLFPLDPRHFGPDVAPRLEAAKAVFEARLAEDPEDIQAHWLLNLAHMATGSWPDGVPARWVIRPGDFYPWTDFTRFEEVAATLGIDDVGHAGGVVFDDLDNDSDFDLLISSRGLADSMHYFENREGTFVDATAASGLLGLRGGLNMVQGDYDNDGDEDVFVLRGAWTPDGHPNSLLRNEGGGRFTDVTVEAGVLSVHPTQTGAWGDYDNDGWLDLVIGNEGESRGAEPRIHELELYHNNRDGTFSEVAAEVGLSSNRFVKAVMWGDYDNDGLVDLLVSAYDEDNALYHNDGPVNGGWRFTDVTATAGVQAPGFSLPAWWFDFDNDGWLDILLIGYRVDGPEQMIGFRRRPEGADTPHLYINRGDGTFEDATARVGLDRVVHTMGSNFGDLDNDGFLDFYLGTGDPDFHTIIPNVMFRNDRGLAVQDVSVAGGFSHMAKGHAVAFTDVDHDGDQDIYVVLGGAMQGDLGRNVLWINPGHGNRWVTLRLEGVDANRSAIGGRIRVTVDGAEGRRDIHALVGSGGSFGASSLQQEIGLGAATRIVEIEVRWPGSGLVQTFADVELDRIYELREGDAGLTPVDQPVMPLAVPGR